MMVKSIIKQGPGQPRALFFTAAVALFVLMMFLAPDYGLTNDEPIHRLHGKVVLHYFQGNVLHWHALEPHFAGPFEGCKEKPFSAKKDVLESFHHLHVERNAALKQGDVSSIHQKLLALCKLVFHDVPIELEEHEPRPRQLLHDEPFPAEQSGREFLLEERLPNAFRSRQV